MADTKMLSLADSAERLGVSVKTVRRMVKDKRIKAVKIGKQWRVSEEELGRVAEEGA